LNSISTYLKENWLLCLIIGVGIAFRFIPIQSYQFSHDELSGLSRTIYGSFGEELKFGVEQDTHPALVQVFLWLWVKLVGYNEISIKLPFLICGVLSIWYIYRLGKDFFNERVGLVSATILSFSFIFLVYSSYARMYITGVLFSILFLHSVFHILFTEQLHKKHYVWFVVFGLLCAYNHHLSCFFAFTVAALSLCYIKKERLLFYSTACLATVLLYLPHLSITLSQFSVGGIGTSVGGWLPPPRSNEIYFFIKTLLGCGISGIINMVLFLGIIIVSVFKLTPISKKQFFLGWIFVLNYMVIHLYSVYKNPILQSSCLLFSGICFILFISSFVSFLSKKQVALFCLLLMGLMSFQTLYKKHYFTKVHVHDFESQCKTTLDMQKQVGKNKVASIYVAEPFFVYVYEKKYHTRFNYITSSDTLINNNHKLKQYLKKLKEPYIVVGAVNPEQMLLIKEQYPYLVSHQEDYYRNTSVFSKLKTNNVDVSVINTLPIFNSDIEIYVNDKKAFTHFGDSLDIHFNEKDNAYPFNVTLPLQKSNLKHGQYMVADLALVVDSISDLAKDQLCLTIGNGKDKAVFYKATPLRDFYDSTQKVQHIYLEFFVGSEFEKWKKQNLVLSAFIQKEKTSHYRMVGCHLKQMDYNPSRWTVLE
jgi:hypothetical protein